MPGPRAETRRGCQDDERSACASHASALWYSCVCVERSIQFNVWDREYRLLGMGVSWEWGYILYGEDMYDRRMNA